MSDRIIFALIGAIVGGLVSGLFVGNACRKRCNDRISELEAENKQLRARMKAERKSKLDKKAAELRMEETKIDASILNQMTMAMEERRKAEKLAQQHGYSHSDAEDDDLEEDDFDSDEEVEFDDPFEESIVVKKPFEKQPPSFKIISQDTYEEDFQYRESESLMFYQKDHVLADAFDDALTNAESIIGEEALNKADNTDGDYVYVLDEVEDKMYEIGINHEESFYKDILRGGEL